MREGIGAASSVSQQRCMAIGVREGRAVASGCDAALQDGRGHSGVSENTDTNAVTNANTATSSNTDPNVKTITDTSTSKIKNTITKNKNKHKYKYRTKYKSKCNY